MKTLRLLCILASVLVLGSCSKDDSTGTDKPVAFTYTIDGAADKTLKQYESVNIPLSVRTLTGTAESVSLTLSGAPSDVMTHIGPESDTPTFSTMLNITVGSGTPTGTYPMKITGASKTGIVVEKSFNLTVTNWNCALAFNNVNMNGSSPCSVLPGSSFQSLVTASASVPQVTISNFAGLGNTVNVECNMNCNNNTLTIPEWRHNSGSNSFSIRGDGTFTDQELNIRFYYADAAGETVCTVRYTR